MPIPTLVLTIHLEEITEMCVCVCVISNLVSSY